MTAQKISFRFSTSSVRQQKLQQSTEFIGLTQQVNFRQEQASPWLVGEWNWTLHFLHKFIQMIHTQLVQVLLQIVTKFLLGSVPTQTWPPWRDWTKRCRNARQIPLRRPQSGHWISVESRFRPINWRNETISLQSLILDLGDGQAGGIVWTRPSKVFGFWVSSVWCPPFETRFKNVYRLFLKPFRESKLKLLSNEFHSRA